MAAQRWLLVFFLGFVLSGCQAERKPPVTTPAPQPRASPAPAPTAAQPTPAAALPNDIKWVQRSAEYYAAILQTYRAATARVEQQAATRTAGSWAVILDADETIISNLQYQIERIGLGYSADSWAAWVHRKEATPLPGAAAFLVRVRQLGGRIAIVTNRLESECEDTRVVFRTHQLPFDAMLCRADKGPSDKNPRFEAVATGKTPASPKPLDVVAAVGDNILDFPGLTQAIRQGGEGAFSEFGVRFFLLPNPMYGSWER
jgi:5'-nucleotidase (lipoprotein e(P4) family)